MTLGSKKIRDRFSPHPGTDVTIPAHEKSREAYIAFAEYLDQLLGPCDPYVAELVMTKLQEASMWTNFAIAQLAPLAQPKIGLPRVTAKPTPPPGKPKG